MSMRTVEGLYRFRQLYRLCPAGGRCWGLVGGANSGFRGLRSGFREPSTVFSATLQIVSRQRPLPKLVRDISCKIAESLARLKVISVGYNR